MIIGFEGSYLILLGATCDGLHLVRLNISAELVVIQQFFSLTINQRTVLSVTTNQRNRLLSFNRLAHSDLYAFHQPRNMNIINQISSTKAAYVCPTQARALA
jgi:hypothetical protein